MSTPRSLGSILHRFWDLCGAKCKAKDEQSRTWMVTLLTTAACPPRWDTHLSFPAVSHRADCVGAQSNSANAQEPLAHQDKQTLEHRSCNLWTAALKRAVPKKLFYPRAHLKTEYFPREAPSSLLPLALTIPSQWIPVGMVQPQSPRLPCWIKCGVPAQEPFPGAGRSSFSTAMHRYPCRSPEEPLPAFPEGETAGASEEENGQSWVFTGSFLLLLRHDFWAI